MYAIELMSTFTGFTICLPESYFYLVATVKSFFVLDFGALFKVLGMIGLGVGFLRVEIITLLWVTASFMLDFLLKSVRVLVAYYFIFSILLVDVAEVLVALGETILEFLASSFENLAWTLFIVLSTSLAFLRLSFKVAVDLFMAN